MIGKMVSDASEFIHAMKGGSMNKLKEKIAEEIRAVYGSCNHPHSKETCSEKLANRILALFPSEPKHDCEKWFDEGGGCSICSQTLLKSPIKSKEDIKEIQDLINGHLADKEAELSSLKARMEVGEIRKVIQDVSWKGGRDVYEHYNIGYSPFHEILATAIVKHLRG